jgi:hypothetical protein
MTGAFSRALNDEAKNFHRMLTRDRVAIEREDTIEGNQNIVAGSSIKKSTSVITTGEVPNCCTAVNVQNGGSVISGDTGNVRHINTTVKISFITKYKYSPGPGTESWCYTCEPTNIMTGRELDTSNPFNPSNYGLDFIDNWTDVYAR